MTDAGIISREELLAWLDDGVGEHVNVMLLRDAPPGDDAAAALVVAYEGELRHWTADRPPGLTTQPPAEVRGRYLVGTMVPDVTNVGLSSFAPVKGARLLGATSYFHAPARDGEAVVISLGKNARLQLFHPV